MEKSYYVYSTRLKKSTWAPRSNIEDEIKKLRNEYKFILQENEKLKSIIAEKESKINSLNNMVKEKTELEKEYQKKLAYEFQKKNEDLEQKFSREKEKLEEQKKKIEIKHSMDIEHLQNEIKELKSQIIKYKRLEEQIDMLLQKS